MVKPSIRFINVGGVSINKHENERLISEAKATYRIPKGNVLIVDKNILNSR